MRKSSVGGGSFIPIVGAICFGPNSSWSDRPEKFPSNSLWTSHISMCATMYL